MKFRFSPASLFVAICLLSLIGLGSQTAQAQQATEEVLYSFTGSAGDGAEPFAGLIMDASGNLYGTTEQGGSSGVGTVFELSSGTYVEKVLYNFTGSGGDGSYPQAGLIMDMAGNLYGTTGEGGASGFGTVFELVNFSGTYSERVLFSFTRSGGGGSTPSAGLIMDASGNLYGTTDGGGGLENEGTVFELVNSSGIYSEKVLYSFTGAAGDGAEPFAGLIMDASGNLYGTTIEGGNSTPCQGGCGTVFELVNSSGTYSEKVLYRFTDSGDGAYPQAGLIMDASGNLYGTAAGDETNSFGTVFEMVNSSGIYSEKVLYSFTGAAGDGALPFAGLIMDASGNLYGTTFIGGTNNQGTVFELVNSSGSYSEKVLYRFTGSGGDGFYPFAGLIMDASGNLYGTTRGGGAMGWGTVFEVTNATALSVSSNPSPSNYGQPVTFTATISDAFGNVRKRSARTAGRPQVVTGTVAWSANTGCGTTSMTSGTATCTTSILPVGDDTVTANYSGNHNAASGSISQTVNQAATTINVTSVSPSSEAYGQDAPVTITAVLSWSGNGSAPTAANVIIGGNGNGTYGATSCGSPSGDTITCAATYAPNTNDTVGAYTETATFSGDSNYTSSMSSQSGNFAITQAGSGTITVSSSQNPSAYGQSVTFTATIPGQYGAIRRNGKVRSQVVTGTVQWSSNTGCGTTAVTTGTPGTATCTTSILPVGTDTVTANYSGDGNHNPGSGSVNQTVSQIPTTTWVASSLDPSTYGQAVHFTATTTETVPSGTVQFNIDGSAFGPAVPFSGPYAYSGSISTLAVGTHTVTAVYSGDTDNSGSTGTLSGGQVVNSAGAGVTVGTSGSPSTYGLSVTFTATINGQYGLIKGRNGKARSQDVTGTVTWSDNTGCGTTSVTSGNPGTATCTTTALNVGTDTVTATYSGDANHGGGSATLSGGQVVNQASQTITFTTPAPALAGFNSSFTVTATASSGLAVTYTSAGSCSNSGATYTITAPTGTCTVTASQSGNSNYLAAASVNESTTAKKGTQTVTFTGAPPTAVYQSSFTVATSQTSGITPTITASSACSIAGDIVTMLTGTGTCTLTARWAANTDYNQATVIQKTTAQKLTPSVTFTGAPATAAYLSTFTVATTQNSGITPTISSTTTSVCSVSGGVVTMKKGTGTCTVKASWAANSYYLAAIVTQTTTATLLGTTTTITSTVPQTNPLKVEVYFTASNGTSTAVTGNVTVTSAPGGETCTGSVTGGKCLLTFTAAGSQTLTAVYAGNTNDAISTSAPYSLTVQ